MMDAEGRQGECLGKEHSQLHGDYVRAQKGALLVLSEDMEGVQNLVGNNPKARYCKVAKVLDFDKFELVFHGSGGLLNSTRTFLLKVMPYIPSMQKVGEDYEELRL